MSRETADLEADATRLCALVEEHLDGLTSAALGRTFRLGPASFRLYQQDRNTIYRVSLGGEWFLKLCRSNDALLMARERLGAERIGATLAGRTDYGGPPVVRVSLKPAYVLATAVPGTPLNRVLISESWLPGPSAAARLEHSFATLGTLLATLHTSAALPPDAPPATKHPFTTLGKRLARISRSDHVTDTIARWYEANARPDHGDSFIHGNMRLDNVLRTGARLAFLDLEHCGSGPFYQDLARPVTHLLQVTAVKPFPRTRLHRCLDAYLGAYRNIHPFDLTLLNVYVGARMSRYYLEIHDHAPLSNRIGGFPVLRSAIGRLTQAVLRDGIEGAVPQLSVWASRATV